MILICCVDDHMGMTFHHRRQSQDRISRQRILERSGGRLWMNSYSAKQFAGEYAEIIVDEHCAENCPKGEYCLIENQPVRGLEPEQILLYRWNRSYPADTYFDIPLENWKLASQDQFQGYSHDRITEEVYTK